MGTALDLIEDLLEVARAEAGDIRVEREHTGLRSIIVSIVQDYQPQAQETGIALTAILPDAVPLVENDPMRVRQVLGNLVSNAVKYTPAGWVRVEAGIRDVAEAGEGVAVDVIDTGPGIAAEKQHLLFQGFVRFESGAAKGTGIGLAFSAQIVDALGGDSLSSANLTEEAAFPSSCR